MNITQKIISDHTLIIEYLKLFHACTQLDDNNNSLLFDNSKLFLEFLRFFNEDFHHTIEEEILFHHLLELEDICLSLDVNRLIQQHDSFKDLFSDLRYAHQHGNMSAFKEYMVTYSAIILRHIQSENALMLPLIEDYIPVKEKIFIMSKYLEMEAKKDGNRLRQYYTERKDEFKGRLQYLKAS